MDLQGLHIVNAHRMMKLDVFWLALGTMELRMLARQCMNTRDESRRAAGPHISAIVTMLLTSFAIAWCGTSRA